MSCEISYSRDFLHDLKRLRKKYRSMDDDLANFLDDLQKDPLQGTNIGRNLRKVRMAISSKGKGKSGGARVITHVIIEVEDTAVKLLTIYDKADKENLSEGELNRLLKRNNLL